MSATICECGHPEMWHSHGGHGDCEHDGACQCDHYTTNDAAADAALTLADIEAHEFDDLDLLRDEHEPFDQVEEGRR